jgi:hypothetical protein
MNISIIKNKNNFYEKYYESIYYEILYKFPNQNYNILSINQNEFNPLIKHSHIIKKYNINIYMLVNSENYNFYEKMKENIIGSECEKNIHLIKKIDEIINIKFEIINIFHLYSLEKLNNILNKINILSDNKTNINIYCSLSNEKKEKIYYKNLIRDKILDFSNIKLGILLSFVDVLDIIEKNKNFNIEQISIYKKNNYIVYGNNTVYKIFLKKI